jgi:hypothetical protein
MTEQAAREIAGEDVVYYGTKLSAASNGKAKKTQQSGPAIAELLNNHTGRNMKYPYTTLDVTTPDCGPRTRRIGRKFWFGEWHRSQHIQQY